MKYYLLGIKGSGMSALASILHDLGNTVIGYDDSIEYKFTLEGLEKRNIKIYHNGDFVPDKDFIVCYSNAIDENHKEIKRLISLNLKMIKYQDLIGSLTKKYETISVAGTHGKTTTSLMISSIIDESIGCNYFVGDGRGHGDIKNKLFVLESCEYNKHFLSYYPKTLVITNIDLEHTECYKDLDDIIDNFNILANQTSDNLVLCGDDPNVLNVKANINTYYYGFNSYNDLVAKNVILDENGCRFDAYFKNKYFETFELSLFGRHMVLDSLACILVCILYNIDKEVIKRKLKEFRGATRRFNETILGDTIIIDDYAHHPTEIKATLDSARQKYKDKKIIGVFLPNTYSRTKDFLDDFASVLSKFDKSYIMDIKCDRENPDDYPGITSDLLISKTKNAEKIGLDNVKILLNEKGNVVCFMSCANITPMINAYKSLL